MTERSLPDWADVVCTWMERQAERDEQAAKTERFLTVKEAYIHDAENYRAMAKQGRAALALARPAPPPG